MTMQPQEKAPLHMQCSDKFLVQSTRVSEACTTEDITSETFNKEMGKIVDEVKVSVAYVAPSQQLSTVWEGDSDTKDATLCNRNEDEDKEDSTLCEHDDDKEESEIVQTLDATNFDALIATHPFIVIEFCVPWFKDFEISAREVGIFLEFTGSEFANFMEVAEKLRCDYEFHHTLNTTHLPGGGTVASSPLTIKRHYGSPPPQPAYYTESGG